MVFLWFSNDFPVISNGLNTAVNAAGSPGGCGFETMGKALGKPWEHGKIIGKSWENYRKMEVYGKIIGKWRLTF